jgi:polar amino acid transport system substrate-binding protein
MNRVVARLLMGLGLLVFSALATVLGATPDAAEEKPSDILLVSEHWIGCTETDGTGLGWDLMREIFEPAGVKVEQRIEPYTRAVGLVQRGEADAWIAAYKDEVEGTLYSAWHYDIYQIYTLGLASKPMPSLNTLGKYRLAWVRGYEYQHYLPNVLHFNEVARRDHILPMLEYGRSDLYVDAKPEMDFILAQSSDPQRYRLTYLTSIPLYLSFADTSRGHALRDLFDSRMSELVRSGKLRPVFAKWKHPYPFDASTGEARAGASH